MELVDTGVWARKGHSSIAPWFASAVEAGDVAICDAVALEILHAARNGSEFEAIEAGLLSMPWVTIESTDWSRAREVYRSLAWQGGGHQRQVPHADLLIAACAERAGLPLVHYDSDYDTIAEITGQSTRWVAPRGTL